MFGGKGFGGGRRKEGGREGGKGSSHGSVGHDASDTPNAAAAGATAGSAAGVVLIIPPGETFFWLVLGLGSSRNVVLFRTGFLG